MTVRFVAQRSFLAAAMIASAFSIGTAGAVELNPAALVYKLPDQLQWRDPLGTSGVNQAVLQGDPTKPGLYVVLNRFKPGNFSRPHFHPNDRFITVVKGTFWVATGNKFDTNNMVPMPTGSFVNALRQAGALGRRQGRGSLGAHRRRRPRHPDAGGRSPVAHGGGTPRLVATTRLH
jgi:hypothetical protein